ncbi:MAG TPA: hypothetical protein PKE66_16485, partial [Pyrinomonadaceae bacterium]|nr:hypothetical protein [Pyrinomonadaceae bacterium]
VGLPGFQFIQDPIEYFGRTWHTTQDVADRTIEEDLKRSAVIMATFAYNAAMSDEKMPRQQAAAGVASLIPGFDYRALNDEQAFAALGLGHQVCGYPVRPEELPNGFPSMFAVSTYFRDGAEAAHGE